MYKKLYLFKIVIEIVLWILKGMKGKIYAVYTSEHMKFVKGQYKLEEQKQRTKGRIKDS